MAKHQGQCLCGSVTVTADTLANELSVCHCESCRRWGGGPLISADTHAAPLFGGEAFISVYSSSDWAERGFCKRCGSHLFYRLKGKAFYALPAGLFGDIDGASLKLQVFIEQKPPFYNFAEKTKILSGDEVFALFAGD